MDQKIRNKEVKVQWTAYHHFQFNMSVARQMKVPVKKRPLQVKDKGIQ